MSTGVAVLLGTRKGAFILESGPERKDWNLRGPYLGGQNVMHMAFDPRSSILFAANGDPWFGSRIYLSRDRGHTWDEPTNGPAFPEGTGETLEKIWQVRPGRPEEPGVVYAGVEPAALFKSTDNGDSWSLVEALSQHPTRERWQPGAGGLCLHTIVLHPTDMKRVLVGISAAGLFATKDGGKSWETSNTGIRANFMPGEPPTYPEFGQCIHKVVAACDGSDWLYQQNHCGVYRSADFGATWQEVTGDLPSEWGLGVAAHPTDPETFYVCPGTSSYQHWVPDAKVTVYRTRDRGDSWERLNEGLPEKDAYVNFLRESIAADQLNPAGIYLGSNTGQLFYSADNGDSWQMLSSLLPTINSVSTATT